jgi:hypothetical protein
MGHDTLTIITARRRLAKLIRGDGTIVDYDRVRTVDLTEVPIWDLTMLARSLCCLLGELSCCVVRGAIIDPTRTRGVRRLLRRDPATGDEPTLRDVPRQWLALDLDSVDRAPEVPASDLARCAAGVIRLLPPSFHGVRCIVQATAGHGIKPGSRLRLWFWLSRPTTGNECKRWLSDTPADGSVFGAAQPIYTAAPMFEPGLSDHLPSRVVELGARRWSRCLRPKISCRSLCNVGRLPCHWHRSL